MIGMNYLQLIAQEIDDGQSRHTFFKLLVLLIIKISATFSWAAHEVFALPITNF